MSNVKAEKESRLREYLLSDANIYHAIYSIESYIFDYNLLEPEDKVLFHKLKDKFSEELLNEVIEKVRKKIKKLLNQEYIETKVFFRPKKIDNETQKLVFRPLHTTDLITQIAIVSMLHLFIYDITEDNKLILSNLSRLLPSNFFGNRVSVNPAYLFKPWKNQYQKYNQKANDALKKYHTSLEYKYEVTLDLENFFPTINPMIIYNYIIRHLPVYFDDKDKIFLGKVLHKLLFCKLKTQLDTKMRAEYYKVSNNHKNGAEITIPVCEYVRGIPQGLPQSYFLGNIYMLIICGIFKKEFPGVSYFYVDDSVIFTNEVSEEKDDFEEKLNIINTLIKQEEEKYISKTTDTKYPSGTENFYQSDLYGVKLHTSNKSSYVRLDTLDESDLYLKCISREVSQGGNDFYRMYSDEENRNLEKKFAKLAEQIETRYKKLAEQIEKLESENDVDLKNVQNIKKIQDKLNRYYKFFAYRRMSLAAMHECDLNKEGKLTEQKQELRQIIFKDETLKEITELRKIKNNKGAVENKNSHRLHSFMEAYCKNIWDAAVGMYIQIADWTEKRELKKYILEIDRLCFGRSGQSFSYMWQVYRELIFEKKKKEETELYLRLMDDPYRSLKEYAAFRLRKYTNKHYSVAEEFCATFAEKSEGEILKNLLPEELINKMKIVSANTEQIVRMVMNTIYSYLFNVDVSDNFIIAKYSRKTLSYGELRILIFLRNRLFRLEEFRKRNFSLKDTGNIADVDYAVMKVVEIFYSFVKKPVWIDELILTHKYTCDVWKNGSKYLYFYTLHNQEHAITLIQNIVKLVQAIDFIKISAIDFYILFQSCYLHDISMVRIPSKDDFLVDTDEADQIAYEFYEKSRTDKDAGEEDILKVKSYILDSYKALDEYFEKRIRSKHADDSASEIRNQSDINYIEPCIREFIAEVSEAHCADEREIYGAKSTGSRQLVSLKFDKILLRLADILDMSSYRVSKPILNHNIDQMSLESAFHWISHLLTEGYVIETEYESKYKDSLTPKSITEKLIFTIEVNMAQMSVCEKKEKCKNVGILAKQIDKEHIALACGRECSNKDCNFLCQWFCVKNNYMVNEFAALEDYLNQNINNYFGCEIEIKIKCNNKVLDEKQFEILNSYLEQKNS